MVPIDKIDTNLPTPSVEGANYNPNLQPPLNSQMICPLPGLFNVSPDSLRQYYRGGQMPQIRLMGPQAMTNSGGGSSSSSAAEVVSSGSSTTVELHTEQIAITTAVLNPNNIFTGTINLGKVFQLVQISSNLPCRVELYGTQNALNIDSFRAIDVAPAFGTAFGLILDVVLDNAAVLPLEGIAGSNLDEPQVALEYISVTNTGNTSSPITVTIVFVPMVI